MRLHSNKWIQGNEQNGGIDPFWTGTRTQMHRRQRVTFFFACGITENTKITHHRLSAIQMGGFEGLAPWETNCVTRITIIAFTILHADRV